MNNLTDQQLVENFIYELDRRGYNFFILKGIRSLLRQENQTRCPKCSDEIKADDDSICGGCI